MRPAPELNRRSTLALLATAAAAALTLPACATDAYVRPQQPVQLTLIDRDSGRPLTVYRKDGRTYVAGQPAARYAIRLSNPTPQRVLVVLSVDGVNVISGDTAAYGQTGYVLDPYRTHDITGWRKSDTAVAAFEFAALSDSYAARTGRPGNVGVIGAAVFLEKPQPVVVPAPPVAEATREQAPRLASKSAAPAAAPAAPAAESSTADAMGASGAVANAARAERLGTGHGAREWSVTRRVEFERLSTSPQQLIELAYDSRANLLAAGVIPRPVYPAPRPQPFPEEQARAYVPDPPLTR